MLKKALIFVILIFIILSFSFGQQQITSSNYYVQPDSQQTYNKYRIPSVLAGTGILTFWGDIGTYYCKILHTGKFNTGFNFAVEQRFNNGFGVSLNCIKGNLTEVDNRPTRHLNFKSDIFQANLACNYHFDNGVILTNTSRFSPYISVGLGSIWFSTKGDLKAKNGKFYHYWPDGTIRDQTFDWENPQNGDTLEKDYKFESTLDSSNKFKHNAITVPVGGGINIKLSDKFEINVSSLFFFTQTDALDNLSYQKTDKFKLFSQYNDSYLFTYLSIQYNLGGLSKLKHDNKFYKDVNFDIINNMDSDGDKVTDVDDKCPDTPSGVSVDATGCPVDADKDGVPDYLDKENNTPIGSIVDENGVTVTQQMLEEKFVKDSLIIAGKLALDKDSTMSFSELTDNDIKYQAKRYSPTNAERLDIEFKIQIGAYKNKVPVEVVNQLFDAIGNKSLIRSKNDEGYTVFIVGSYKDYSSAVEFKNKLVKKGIKDAFVVAFQNNKPIDVSKAINLIK